MVRPLFAIVYDVLWRLSPYSWKQAIKSFLHLGKPQLVEVEQQQIENALTIQITKDAQQTHARLFTCIDYSAAVQTKDLATAETYLVQVIDAKLLVLQACSNHANKKIQDKIAVLTELKTKVAQHSKIDKRQLQTAYSLAFQSFWKEKGEVEQIVDAALALEAKYSKQEACAAPLMPAA